MTDARDIEQAKADLESDQVCCITWVERHADKLLTDLATLRKQLEDAREALNKADSALRGGHAIIVNQLPHAPWLRTMDEAIEAISALKGTQ